MPVVKLVGLLVERRSVQDEVEGRPRQDAVHPSQGFRENGGQQLEVRFLTILEICRVPLREDPHLEGKPRGEWGNGHELRVLSNQTVAISEFLPENVAIDAPFPLLEMRAAPFDLGRDAAGDDG